jgi:anti-sigma28 factor (negative regulator of flagellin synthesis)
MRTRLTIIGCVQTLSLLLIAGTATAQTTAQTEKSTTTKTATKAAATTTDSTAVGTPTTVSTGIPQKDTLLRMMTPISVDFQERRLEDVLNFIKSVTTADIDIMWMDDKGNSGLDKETLITAKVDNMSMLRLLEIVLEKASTADANLATNMPTWQMTESGAMQIGPRDRLNKFRRVELYAVNDLLLETPNYDNAPEFDLQAALQDRGRGGGGGQSPFTEAGDEDPAKRPLQEKVDELQSIITAPDYIHRQLNGYPYWPAGTKITKSNGRRYVTLGIDNSFSGVRSIQTVPVTAETK